MARPGTQEQPTVEEMLVSIRQAIHGENAKKRSSSKAVTPPPTPPAVSGSMRQMRVKMESNFTKPSSQVKPRQNSVRTHSDNFQKLKKQLHDLDPLLGKQGREGAKDYKARSANGFAGILSGDVKLEEALAKLERAGLGDAQPEATPEPHHEPSALSPRYEPEPQLRGVEPLEDDFDEYEFDDNQFDEPEIRQSSNDHEYGELGETYYEESPQQYDDQTPSYIQRAPEPQTPPAPIAPPVAPPIARAPLAPPPAPRQPSYGYLDDPINEQHHAPEPYQAHQEPVAPTPQYIAPEPIERPVMRQSVAAPQPVSPPMVPTARTVSPSVQETGLTSPQNAKDASDMFASLAQTIMHQASTGNRSIDVITKELLHPMLRSWLDENLPGMVERLIREEIERVARGGAR